MDFESVIDGLPVGPARDRAAAAWASAKAHLAAGRKREAAEAREAAFDAAGDAYLEA